MEGAKSPFQQMLENDIANVFLNEREFGEWHTIDKKRVKIVCDNDALRMSMEKSQVFGSDANLLYFVKVGDLPKNPIEGATQIFDGQAAIIVRAVEDSGMCEVALKIQRAGGAAWA